MLAAGCWIRDTDHWKFDDIECGINIKSQIQNGNMAYYENLPIYKKAMELSVFVEKSVRDFSRYHKYTIGSDLRDKSRELVVKIVKANSTREKLPLLTELRDQAEELKIICNIGKEVGAFKSFKQFQKTAELIVNICRQAEGWLKSQKKTGPESRRK